MPRRKSNGRFSKTTRTRRRSKPKTNLTNLAVSALVANSISTNVAGLGAWDFLTSGTSLNPSRGKSGWAVSGDPHRNMVTLQEMLSGEQTSGQSIQDALMQNIKKNWLPMTMAVVFIPVGARVITKLIRKPVILPANRMLKSVGLDVKV